MSPKKSILSPRIKGMVEWQLEHYHEDLRTIETLKSDLVPSPVQKLSYERHGRDVSRSTENVAERIMSNPYILHLEKSVSAITYVLSKCDDTDRKIIEAVYFRRSFTVEGAALQIHVSTATAYRRINNILAAIALELGYVNALE